MYTLAIFFVFVNSSKESSYRTKGGMSRLSRLSFYFSTQASHMDNPVGQKQTRLDSAPAKGL